MNKEKAQRLLTWFLDYGWELLNGTSILFIGIIKLFWSNLGTYLAFILLFIFIISYIISLFYIIKNKKRISVLESKISRLEQELEKEKEFLVNYKDKISEEQKQEYDKYQNTIVKVNNGFESLINSYTSLVFSKLNLTTNDRISIYKHSGNSFSLLTRYSSNPEYLKKGRLNYPDDVGYISIGYQNDSHQVENLPDPNYDLESYLKEIKDTSKMKKDVTKNLKMKSRVFYIYSIKHPIRDVKIAVVVFESTNIDFINKKTSIGSIIEELKSQVVSYLHYTKDLEPELSFAKKQGL